MSYNLSAIKMANTTLELVSGVNSSVMGSLFFIFLFIVVGALLLLNLQNFQGKEVFLYIGFFISFMAGAAWIAGLVSLFVPIMALIILIISMIVFVISN